jgi:hypothetical protein
MNDEFKIMKEEEKEIEIINIPPIELVWSKWFQWDEIKADARKGGVKVPNKKPGVYEVKYVDQEERLTIGKTSDLRMRIKEGLVRGKNPHSEGLYRGCLDTSLFPRRQLPVG